MPFGQEAGGPWPRPRAGTSLRSSGSTGPGSPNRPAPPSDDSAPTTHTTNQTQPNSTVSSPIQTSELPQPPIGSGARLQLLLNAFDLLHRVVVALVHTRLGLRRRRRPIRATEAEGSRQQRRTFIDPSFEKLNLASNSSTAAAMFGKPDAAAPLSCSASSTRSSRFSTDDFRPPCTRSMSLSVCGERVTQC